ncbi:Ger(x)C family spore germination protein [Paenibacillus agaridevorans]|uniref:Ger(x)C family spore germination protein n=1 Tax=Paenibacillus agaridevorans TaxID=171404 RepID=UPI001BE488C4|nr:Ger(x)C family spore germination protein [Paenibacillus agaridevorans]
MNRRLLFTGCIVLSICAFLLTACWDIKDINNRYLPIVMAVDDREGGKYRVVLHYPLPGGQGLASVEESAATVSKAIDLMRTNVEKDISLLHIKLLIISKKLAEKGIGELLDVSLRSREISPKALLAIASDDFDLMNEALDKSKGTETASFDFFNKQAGWTPNIPITPLWEAYGAWHSRTEDVAIPLISTGKEKGQFAFEDSAVMREDRMVAAISRDDTMLYNLFHGQYEGGTFEIDKQVTVRIIESSITHRTKWVQSFPTMTSRIKIVALVLENKGGPVSNEELKAMMERSIRRRCEALIGKLNTSRADLLGTGKYFRGIMSDSEREHWKSDWYPKLKHEVEVNVTIGNAGYLKSKQKHISTYRDRNER